MNSKKVSTAADSHLSELASERLYRLLLRYAMPAIIATCAASLYNIIDRIFIGQGVGALAISGLALTFPMMNLSVALGTLVGAGGSAVMSIRLGEHKTEDALLILGNSVSANLLIGSIFAVVGLVFLDPILYAFGASEATLPYARDFMQVILIANPITHLYFGLNNLVRVSGYPRKAMRSTLLTVGCNLALAPLFIFGFGWGIRGAALATVCAQCVGLGFVLYHFRHAPTVYFKRGIYALKLPILKDMFAIGMSPFLLHICASLVAVLVNRSLVFHGGDIAIGAYGIINSVMGLMAMIVIGLNQGMQPIVGYNYGAQNFARVRKTYFLTVGFAVLLMAMGWAVTESFPRVIARAFTSSEELIGIAAQGMRIVLAVVPLVGFQMVTSNFFQAIGRAKISIFLSLSRQVLFLIPMLLILPRTYGLNGVWVSIPAADAVSSIAALGVIVWTMRNLKSSA